jgi:hypothetical protein
VVTKPDGDSFMGTTDESAGRLVFVSIAVVPSNDASRRDVQGDFARRNAWEKPTSDQVTNEETTASGQWSTKMVQFLRGVLN